MDFQSLHKLIALVELSLFYSKAVNILMRKGLKRKAQILLYRALMEVKLRAIKDYGTTFFGNDYIKEIDPFYIFDKAIEKAKPDMILTKVGKRGLIYQVPTTVTPLKSRYIAIMWLIDSANITKAVTETFDIRLGKEIYDTYNNRGNVLKNKNELMRKIEENRAFVTYKWS